MDKSAAAVFVVFEKNAKNIFLNGQKNHKDSFFYVKRSHPHEMFKYCTSIKAITEDIPKRLICQFIVSYVGF